MVRQKRNDEQDTPPISGLTLALLLAFFGMSCSLISRIHNPGDAASITAVLGIASGFVLGVPFVLGRFSAEPSLVLSSQLATILVVIVTLVAYLLVGDTVSFIVVHFLLAIGMVYEVVSWVAFARWLLAKTGRLRVALAGGFAFLCLYVLLGEAEAVGVMALLPDLTTATMAGMAQIILVLALFGAVFFSGNRATRRDPRRRSDDSDARSFQEEAAERVAQRAERYGLTQREIGLLAALSLGASLADVAEREGLSTGTVKSHLSHAYRKLGVSNRSQAMVLLLGEENGRALK